MPPIHSSIPGFHSNAPNTNRAIINVICYTTSPSAMESHGVCCKKADGHRSARAYMCDMREVLRTEVVYKTMFGKEGCS